MPRREVARHLGTEHHEITLSGRDALDVVPHLAGPLRRALRRFVADPDLAGPRFAREQVTVALSGDAGDESFAGYTRYHVGDGFWKPRAAHPVSAGRGLSGAIGAAPGPFWDKLAGGLGPLCPRLLRASPGDKFARVARMLKGHSPADFYDELISHWKDPSQLVPGAKLAPLALGAEARRRGAPAATSNT